MNFALFLRNGQKKNALGSDVKKTQNSAGRAWKKKLRKKLKISRGGK